VSAPAVAERPQPLADRVPHEIGRTDARGRPSERSGGGRLTLEQRLDGVWEGLRADGAADCPVCHGRMTLDPGGASAGCGDCGTRLS
jgi:DnaJ-class molecular chaperone